MQKVIIIGNVGKDPEVKAFDNGGKVANFNVGVTERGYTTNSGKTIPDHTEWFRCSVRQNGLCGVVEQYVRKGNKVAVSGKFRTREFEREGGQKGTITELIVDELSLLTPKSDSSAGSPSASQQPPTTAPAPKEDDLPF